jgi:hypothetical protein
MKSLYHCMAVFLCGSVVLASAPSGFAAPTTTSTSHPAPEAVQQDPQQLRELVAPIALYPDPLVAQIMAAATYPSEVMEAQQWMQQHQALKGDALAKEVDKQSWELSVKALTQFPAVLANMSQNLAWTSELGDAYVNQRQNLTQTIQTMRRQAMNAGNLKSTPQEKVTSDEHTIEIQPAAKDVVYVPQYDPWIVYGDPLAVFPGWAPWPGLYFDGPGIGFGLGFGIGLFAGFGWGWNHWGADWHHGFATYNRHRDVANRSGVHSVNHSFHSTMNAHHFSGRSSAGHGFSHGARSLHASAASHSSSHAYFHSASHGGGFHGFHGGGFHGGGHGGGHGGHGR